MQYKKVVAGFLTGAILSVSAVTAFAIDARDVKTIGEIQGRDIIPISIQIEEEKQNYFGSFTGIVKEIRDFEGVEGSRFVLVENNDGMLANIVVSNKTYIAGGKDIKIGSEITGFFRADAPMIMIYPPQYTAEVVVVNGGEDNIKVDRFDPDLISSDNSLKLKVSGDTEIIFQDGSKFEGELANRKLVVSYGISTRSIPAQTTPVKIVVLFEEVEPIYTITKDITEKTEPFILDVSGMDIIVENKRIDAPAAYVNEQGTVMVPLRAIAEALGFEVTWHRDTQSVTLDKRISLTLGKDYYTYMKTAPIKLGTAPAVINQRTFVPLSFFREVARINNAYIFEGQIVIDNGELMR